MVARVAWLLLGLAAACHTGALVALALQRPFVHYLMAGGLAAFAASLVALAGWPSRNRRRGH